MGEYLDAANVGYVDTPGLTEETLISKTSKHLELLHTGGEGDNTDEGKIVTYFQAVALPINRSQPLQQDLTYLATAAAAFEGDAYVWISAVEIKTDLSYEIHPLEVVINDLGDNVTLAKGQGLFVEIIVKNTQPISDVKFISFDPQGYNDDLHFGHVIYELGGSFGCSQKKYWREEYDKSPSGYTINRATVSYESLVNRDGKNELVTSQLSMSLFLATRNVSDPNNWITFRTSVSVTDLPTVQIGRTRLATFFVSVGEHTWFKTVEILLMDRQGQGEAREPFLQTVLYRLIPLIDPSFIAFAYE